MLERQAREAGRRTAIVDQLGDTTYARLWADATNAAGALRQASVHAGDVVAVAADRGAAFITAALGCWIADAVYLPLAPDVPAARLRRMVAGAGARVVLCSPGRAADCAAAGLVTVGVPLAPRDEPTGRLDPLPSALPGNARDAAYLLYTSGSTGEPKGVLVGHASLANLVAWHLRAYAVGPGDRALHTASLGFDAGVWEIWPYLAAGATVVACPDEDRVVAAFAAEQLTRHRCTIAFLATPLAEELIRLGEELPRLRYLLTGGDALRLPGPVRGPWRLVNHYGPTEATVVTTAHVVVRDEPGSAPPIGAPIDNVRVLLLDADRRPVPDGVDGEIYIGGRGLALGYLGDPDLTSRRFVSVPGEPGLWYRTADLATSLRGTLTFRGRTDVEQLKVRGIRIEATEIEAALMDCPGVDGAAVTLCGQGSAGILVAVLVGTGPLARQQLRAELATRLPAGVLPNRYMVVDRLPLTSNGKLDRKLVADLAEAAVSQPAPTLSEDSHAGR